MALIPFDAATAAAFCGCAVFAATMPAFGHGLVPPIVRVTFALALTYLLSGFEVHGSAHREPWMQTFIQTAPRLAATGAIAGLGATLIAGAAGGAGSVIDAALGSPPAGSVRFFGAGLGPFGLMYSAGFAFAMFASGAATRVIGAFVEAARAGSSPTAGGAEIASAMQAGFQSALGLAAPALFAQGLATLVAAIVSRVSPRSNATMAASAMASLLIVAAALVRAPSLFADLADIAQRCAFAARISLP